MKETSSRSPTCTNCGTVSHGTFCPSCGQKRGSLRIPLWEFAVDALDTLFSLDNRIFRTVVPLLTRPGFVTAESFAGHRARYVPPMRLYLFVSFLFFLTLKLSGGVIVVNDGSLTAKTGKGIITFNTKPEDKSQPSASALSTKGTQPSKPRDSKPGNKGVAVDTATSDPTEPAERASVVGRAFGNIQNDPQRALGPLLQRLAWMLFLLVPVAAVWLRLLFRAQERFYVPHLVASLYLHSAVLLILTLSHLTEMLPGPDLLGSLLVLWIPFHIILSLRRIYGLSLWSTLWRLTILSLVHALTLAISLFSSIILTGLSLS